MIDPTVRAATIDDAAELVELEHEARVALVEARGGQRWLEEHRVVGAGWVARIDLGGVFVAELAAPDGSWPGPVVVGFVVVDVDSDVAVVDQVYVTPAARELGFGDALLDAALDAARRGQARLFEGQALPGDRNTKNLYERAGITARLITVSKPVAAVQRVSDPATGASVSR